MFQIEEQQVQKSKIGKARWVQGPEIFMPVHHGWKRQGRQYEVDEGGRSYDCTGLFRLGKGIWTVLPVPW